MPNDWIIDVLSDLQTFSRQNGLFALDRELERTIAVARGEVERRGRDASDGRDARPPAMRHRPAPGGD